ncbi:MAG: hypothetical protein ACREIR_06085 [Geminicoccaceae bacterium]
MTMHDDASPTDRDETDTAAAAASDRRRFLKGALVAGSAAASLVGLAGNHVSTARAQGVQASVGVDFGITQVVDGNWGVHAVLKKSLFAGAA